MKFVVSTKKITIVLAMAVLFLTCASLAAQFFMYIWGREGLLAFLPVFNVGEDANIPTWYSSFMLLLCSILLATIAAASKRYSDRYTLHWSVLSIILLFLSIDEVATIHEHTGEVFKSLVEARGFTPSGFIYSAWVVPGLVFAFVVALAYLRFLVNLPRKTRNLFLIAGVVFVAGAIGMETLSARLMSFYGWENWGYVPDTTKMAIAIQTAIEELLEMLSIIVFIYALLSYASSYVKEMAILLVHESDSGTDDKHSSELGDRERIRRTRSA